MATNRRSKWSGWSQALGLALALGPPAVSSLAIDNPDTPDLVADFRSRDAEHELRIRSASKTTLEMGTAYAEYERFLDGEMSQAYERLYGKLKPAGEDELSRSQARWIAYRDAEFRFIDENWTSIQFGSSSLLSRGDYRSSIVRDRTVALLSYLKNYPK